MNELDNLPNAFYWGRTKAFGIWRMIRKSTDRQNWGQPWKDIKSEKRVIWSEIRDRYSELVEAKHP